MLTNRIEEVILQNLFFNEEYVRRVFPFLQSELFFEKHEQIVFDKISDYVSKYNSNPSPEAVLIQCDNDPTIADAHYGKVVDLLGVLSKSQNSKQNFDWLVAETEKFCKEKSLTKAILEAHEVSQNPKSNKGQIPEILQKALSVSFDTNIGHSYVDDAEDRFLSYNVVESKTSCDLDLLNLITDGGVPDGTLNLISAATGGGKSLFLCHLAASYLMQKLNVLYITLEMSETKIAERIDANLLNMPVKDLKSMDQAVFINRVRNLQQQQSGKLIIKEYPTGSANVTHFRHLLQELNLKKNFVPDVILIDYLGIAASSRFKLNNAVGMYTYIKAVAEEVRGLAQEFKVPIWSAAQLNREGFKNSDPGMENTSESFGLPFTADFMIALISTEELDAMNQITVKQLKNRYNDPSYYKRFNLGIDRSRMKLYNLTDTSTTKSKSSNEDIIVPSRGRKDYNFSNIEIYEDMLHIDEELF